MRVADRTGAGSSFAGDYCSPVYLEALRPLGVVGRRSPRGPSANRQAALGLSRDRGRADRSRASRHCLPRSDADPPVRRRSGAPGGRGRTGIAGGMGTAVQDYDRGSGRPIVTVLAGQPRSASGPLPRRRRWLDQHGPANGRHHLRRAPYPVDIVLADVELTGGAGPGPAHAVAGRADLSSSSRWASRRPGGCWPPSRRRRPRNPSARSARPFRAMNSTCSSTDQASRGRSPRRLVGPDTRAAPRGLLLPCGPGPSRR